MVNAIWSADLIFTVWTFNIVQQLGAARGECRPVGVRRGLFAGYRAVLVEGRDESRGLEP